MKRQYFFVPPKGHAIHIAQLLSVKGTAKTHISSFRGQTLTSVIRPQTYET